MCLKETSVIADGLEKVKRLLKAICRSVIKESHIIAVEGTDKQYCSGVFKTVDPLPLLRARATHFHHPVDTCAYLEYSLSNSNSHNSRSKHILFIGNIARCQEAWQVLKIVGCRIIQLVLRSV